MGERYSRSAYMAVVLIEDILDSCLSGTLIDVCFGRSIYIAMSLIKGTYFLTLKGGSLWESTEFLSSTATRS